MLNNRQGNNNRRRGRNNNQRPQGNGQNRNGENGSRIDNRARGNAPQLLEKYRNLAREAQMAGDRVQTEYYLQFADHYFRVVSEARARFEDQRRGRDDWDEDGDDQPNDTNGYDADDDMADAPAASPEPRSADRSPEQRTREPRSNDQRRTEPRQPDQYNDRAERTQAQQPADADATEPNDADDGDAPRPQRRNGFERFVRPRPPARDRAGETGAPRDEAGETGAPLTLSADVLPPAIAPTPMAEGDADAAPVAPPRKRGRPRKVVETPEAEPAD